MEDNTQNNQEIKTEIIEQIKTSTTNNNKDLLNINEENNSKEKATNNKLRIEKINKIMLQNNKSLKKWQDEKENKLRKTLTATLNEYIEKLKKLNCEIHKNKEEIEKYLNYTISNIFCENLIYLHKFSNLFEFNDLFNLDFKSEMNAAKVLTHDLMKNLKIKERDILKTRNKILSLLAEKTTSSSNEFKFKKLHEIIKKIKEKQTYLNEIKNFVEMLFKRNENEKDLEKSSENKLLSLKEAQSYLEKIFENFKKTSKDKNEFLDDCLKTYAILIDKLNNLFLITNEMKNIEKNYVEYFFGDKEKKLKNLIKFCLCYYSDIPSIIKSAITEKNSLLKNYKKLNGNI